MQEMLCSLELERKPVWVARRLFFRVYLRCFLPAVTTQHLVSCLHDPAKLSRSSKSDSSRAAGANHAKSQHCRHGWMANLEFAVCTGK